MNVAASSSIYPTRRARSGTPAPPRFLPEYDNILLSHDDRSRIIRDNCGLRMPAGRGGELGSVLVDGFLGGMWRIARQRGKATLVIEAGALGREPIRWPLPTRERGSSPSPPPNTRDHDIQVIETPVAKAGAPHSADVVP